MKHILSCLIIFYFFIRIKSHSLNFSCGKSKNVKGLIAGGQSLERGDFPWMVAVMFKDHKNPKLKLTYICGGTLVSARKTVTAAHCVHRKNSIPTLPKDLRLLFGAYDLEDYDETSRIIEPVSHITVHDHWNSAIERYNDDIAVLHLEEDVHFSRFIQPICLSEKIDNADSGIIAGWGKTANSTSYNEKIPTEISVRIIPSNGECYETQPGLATIGYKNSFCAGSEKVKVCQGDSGSGLMVKINEIYYLKGIVSATEHDIYTLCSLNNLAIFTNVPKYVTFIEGSSLASDDHYKHTTTLRTSTLATTRRRSYLRSRISDSDWNFPEGDDEINSDGSMLFDVRFDGTLTLREEPKFVNNFAQCCKETSEFNNTSFSDDGSDESFDLRYYSKHKSKNKCNSGITNPEKCGFHNPKGIGGGIVNSMQNKTSHAQYAEFPWIMAVLIEKDDKKFVPKNLCGESLIHPRVVLTAAHNIAGIDPAKLVVRGGEWNTQTENELCPHVERNVERVIIHKKFNRQNLKNDIALLILEEGFEMTPFINTVCLPPKDSKFNQERCLSAGWGKNKFEKEGIHQVFLKKVEVSIVPNAECQTKLRKTRLGPDFKLFDGFLCAGGEEGKDMCTGDSGSPLMCEVENNPGHYHQVGIVVGGIGCGQKDVPGLYTDVSNYREWIRKKIGKL